MRAHRVPDFLRDLEVLAEGFRILRPESEHFPLDEERETRLGRLGDELGARLLATAARVVLTQAGQGRAQPMRASRQGFGALAGDFRLDRGELFFFDAQWSSFQCAGCETRILAARAHIAAYCRAS